MSTIFTIQREVPASLLHPKKTFEANFTLDAIDSDNLKPVLNNLIHEYRVPSLSGPLANYTFCFNPNPQPMILVTACQSYQD